METASPAPHVDFLPRATLDTPGRLGLTHRPGAFGIGRSMDPDERLDRDVRSYAEVHRATRLVTLLDDLELAELGRVDLACRRAGLRWTHFPIDDLSAPPSLPATARLAGSLLRALKRGETVIVHCRAGLGRSGLLAACVLILDGLAVARAIRLVREARPGAIEAERQERFLAEFAAAMAARTSRR